MGQVHLERALSKLGIMSRSQTKRCIEEGRIAVNGRIIKDPSFLLVPEIAKITLDGSFPHNKKNQIKGIITDFVKRFAKHLSVEKFEYADQDTCDLIPYFYLLE